VAEQQLREVAQAADAAGSGLYLDLPLGVHRAAYDVAAEPESFATGIRAGAPPDVLGPAGQDWELPPLHPIGSRATGHRYTIACLRTAFRHARALRIDHVAGFHRLFWIPEGFEAADGLYVRYPAEELYAIVLVEAHRRGAIVIGEDLGTVPPVVRETLTELGILRSYVLQFELGPDDDRPAPDPPPLSLAGLGTHDTPTFAAWWRRGREPQAAPAEASRRLAELGAGPARFVLASLEDLWDEARPQNVPGTTGGENWRRRARHDVAALERLPVVDATFRALKEVRP
jgi:4-alpha-glucanotransferase